MSSYGAELPLADYQQAIAYLREHGQGSGVMRCLRDSRGVEHERWYCLCLDTCDFDSREYRITSETFNLIRPMLTGNTYVGYNRWFIYDYCTPEEDE